MIIMCRKLFDAVNVCTIVQKNEIQKRYQISEMVMLVMGQQEEMADG